MNTKDIIRLTEEKDEILRGIYDIFITVCTNNEKHQCVKNKNEFIEQALKSCRKLVADNRFLREENIKLGRNLHKYELSGDKFS